MHSEKKLTVPFKSKCRQEVSQLSGLTENSSSWPALHNDNRAREVRRWPITGCHSMIKMVSFQEHSLLGIVRSDKVTRKGGSFTRGGPTPALKTHIPTRRHRDPPTDSNPDIYSLSTPIPFLGFINSTCRHKTMASPNTNGVENVQDHSADHGLSNLSLSSRTIHADDYLNEGSDVAPPIHVSTTFRYNRDPTTLKAWAERTVIHLPT